MSPPPCDAPTPRTVGRYRLFGAFASGGMATVHFGRTLGDHGFARTVAIKRLLPHFVRSPEFVAMFLDEARLAARVRHPNVVATLDVVAPEGEGEREIFVVMDYVHGVSLRELLRAAGGGLAPGVAVAIVRDVLHGLHAAHRATDEAGRPLGIVHRDVSPENVIVGIDGVARVLDFGVAKAAGRRTETPAGQLKGKLAYMAPEQVCYDTLDPRADVYAASVVLWEALTGRRLFDGESEGHVLARVLNADVDPPSERASGLPPAIDDVVLRGLARDPAARYPDADAMAAALIEACPPSSAGHVATVITSLARAKLDERERVVRAIETGADAVGATPVDDAGPSASGPAAVARPGDAARSPSTRGPATHHDAGLAAATFDLASAAPTVIESCLVSAPARERRSAAWHSRRALGAACAASVVAVLSALIIARAHRPAVDARDSKADVAALVRPPILSSTPAATSATADVVLPPPASTLATTDAPASATRSGGARPKTPTRARQARGKAPCSPFTTGDDGVIRVNRACL